MKNTTNNANNIKDLNNVLLFINNVLKLYIKIPKLY